MVQKHVAGGIALAPAEPTDTHTLPLLSRKTAWTVLIDAQTAQPVGFVALDSF